MTKSLSQQLCELCGIEPRYYINTNIGVFRKDNKKDAEEIALKYNSVVLDVYPDFENNGNNFLELFNLYLNESVMTVTDLTLLFDRSSSAMTKISNVRAYLRRLIELIKLDYQDVFRASKIKQIIKQTEWEY